MASEGASGADAPTGSQAPDAQTPRWVGPVTLQPTFPFVAYALGGLDGEPTMCFTAPLDDHHALLEHLQRLVQASLVFLTRELAQGHDLPGLVVRVHDGASRLSFEPWVGPRLEPEDLALAALRSMKGRFVRDIAGVRCVVEQSAPEGDEIRCRHDFWLEAAPQRRGHLYLEEDPDHEALDKALQGFVAASGPGGVIDEFDRDLYLHEAAACTDPLAAFRSFSHAVVLSLESADARELLQVGLRVHRLLGAAVMPDCADWVAGRMVELAHRLGEPAIEIAMLRLQGIDLSQLGRASEALACFAHADALLPGNADRALETLVRMSHGLVTTDLSVHWEMLSLEARRRAAPELAVRLDVAQRQLLIARDLLAASQADSALRNHAFIGLELLRLRDLRGDHAGALADLSALPAASRGAPETQAFAGFSGIDRSKYDATLIHYRLAAALKLHEAELATVTATSSADDLPATRRLLRDEIPRAAAQFAALPDKGWIRDRQCALAVLVSKVSLQQALGLHAAASASTDGSVSLQSCQKDLEETRLNLQTAIDLRHRMESGDMRPPRAGIEYGGLAAIDLPGMLQHGLLLLAELRKDPSLVWQALSVADASKGRFFKRDLAFSRPVPAGGAPASMPAVSRVLQHALVRGEVDHRLLMADLEWSLQHDLSPEAAAALREATCYEQGIEQDGIRALLSADATPTALIAFYATPQESIVYVVTSADLAPRMFRLVIDLAQLEGVVRDVESEVVGAMLGLQASATPEVLQGLQRLLLPLLDGLQGIGRLVIVPHGPWHGIPVHAVLMPALWQAGRDVAFAYLPSLRAMQLLRDRHAAGRATERKPIAVATVPAREDPLAPFKGEHERLVDLLRKTGRPLDAAFGAEATLERVLEASSAAGLRHLLGHGVDMGVDQAMRSGVLLADGTALPSREGDPSGQRMLTATHELAQGTAASHVTLQACGLGHQHGAHRDELWGMVRAMIAGGASSVLAPMWAVSLTASGTLLRDFYQRWLIDGVTPGLALARAQRAMAEGVHEAHRHFAHWGAFQWIGDCVDPEPPDAARSG